MKKLNQMGTLDTLLILGTIVVLLVGGVVLFALTSDTDAPSVETEQQEQAEEDEQPPAERENLETVQGVLNEVFEDCARYRVFESGEVVEKDEISCDGGSFIVIEDTRIQTSAGFVSADQYYIKDISELTPGEQVKVTYIPGEFGNTLNCEECEIVKL